MEDIQTQAIKTFSENFEFLSEYDAEVFNKVAAMQQAIETGQYKENYSLEYKDGYFDVQSLHDGSWLYGQDTNEHAKQKVDEITYKKTDLSLSLNYRYNYTDAMIEDLDKLSAVNSSLVLTAPVEHTLTKMGGRGELMSKIYKFAFLGVGLGIHLKPIHEKIEAYHYLVVEDNLELFYLSLFVCNYKELSKKTKLFFCIMENTNGFQKVFEAFQSHAWMRNDFLKFSLFSDQYEMKIKQMQSMAVTKSAIAYPHNFLLRKNINISKALTEGYNFLNISQIYKDSPLKSKKVLFLAAGPSLSKHTKWIKENRDKFFIVAVFMIAAKLKDAGIKPDIFVHVDENVPPIEGTLAKFGDKFEYFEGCKFLLSASVPFQAFSKITIKEYMYLVEDRTRYKQGFGFLDFYSVGEAGYSLCLHLGADELYLIGLDLALDQVTGQTHADGHSSSGSKKDLSKKDESEEVVSLKDTVLNVKANRGGVVGTTPLFEASIRMLNIITQKLLTTQKVYNLGDGAFFDKTIPLEAKDIVFSENDIRLSREQVESFLSSISSNTFTKIEENNFITRKQDFKRKIRAIKKFSSTYLRDKKELYNQFANIAEELAKQPTNGLIENSEILSAYMQNICNHVGEYFNTKDVKDKKEDLKAIQSVLAKVLHKLISAFGYMKFDYIEPNKYFNPLECKDLEDKVLDFSLNYQNFSQFKEIYFGERLRLDSEGKLLERVELKPLEEKEGIGFLTTMSNLHDEKYIEYLKKILNEIEEAKLVAFYFEEYQKAVVKDKFKEFRDRVICKEVVGIVDIINGCRVYLVNGNLYDKGDTDAIHVYNLTHLLKISTLYPVVFGMKGFEKSVAEYEGKNRDAEKFFNHLDYFGFQERNKEEYVHTFLWNTISKEVFGKSSKITSEMKMSDIVITHILRNFIKSDAYLDRAIRFYKDCKRFSGC